MKNLMLNALMCFILSSCSWSLAAQDCADATAEIDLDANNVSAHLLIGGGLFWDGNEGKYIAPKPDAGEPEVSAIFAAGMWMGGVDPAGNLKMSAQTYGSSSYWPGPISENGTTDEATCANYDRFWTTNSLDINNHLADFGDNGVIDNAIPESILGWPATGNANFNSLNGFDLPANNSQGMAPFFDQNGNGIYEPELGDYPEVKGADLAIWWVFNDAGSVSDFDPMRIETQVLAYSYASGNQELNNATFYDYKVINRGFENLDSVYIGMWVDPDLGCHTDDYIGSLSDRDMAIVYNSDATDGDNGCTCAGGVNTYCEEVPVLGIEVIKGPLAGRNFGPNGELYNASSYENPDTVVQLGMSSFVYYVNGGLLTPPYTVGMTDPSTGTEHYNYLNGRFRDGTPITTGGTGYDPQSTDYTNYALDGNPSNSDAWTSCSENLISQDFRMLINSGPFSMAPGFVNEMTYGIYFAEDIPHPCPDFDNLFNGLMSSVEVVEPLPLSIFPNPMSHITQLEFGDLESEIERVEIFDLAGRKVRSYEQINDATLQIERGTMNAGIYFVRAISKEGRMGTIKFVVQ